MMPKSFISAWFMLLLITQVNAQDKAQPSQIPAETSDPLELVESGSFMFKADRALPSGAGSIDVTTRPNKVEVIDEIAKGDLAFFGSNTMAAYNPEGGGIKFDGEIKNKKIKKKEKRNQLILSFSVQGKGDNYSCIFTITQSGSASLTINSNHRSTISYNGRIYPLVE